MLGHFKKLFSVLLVAVIFAAAVALPNVTTAANPAKPVFKIVKRAKKSVTLKINKTKNATGYQVFIANSKNSKYKQTAASRMRTVKITKLKKDKAYYIKIRAFKTVGYHITYGKFSKAIKVDKYSKKKPKPKPTQKPSAKPDTSTGSAIGDAEPDTSTDSAIGDTEEPSKTVETRIIIPVLVMKEKLDVRY